MHIGLSMECDYRPQLSQQEAFDEAFLMADEAERLGLDGVWLAERHFASNRNTGGVPANLASQLGNWSGFWSGNSWCTFSGTICRT